jgi:IS5 family transposase
VALESIPQRGGRNPPQRAAYEKSRRFKRAQKFRAGIEGRTSVLARGRGMKRCLLRGRDGFEMLVGAAVHRPLWREVAKGKKQRHYRSFRFVPT